MVVSSEGIVAVYQLGDSPAPVQIKVRAAALGADRLEVVGPKGTAGTWQLAQQELREYTLTVPDVPPGRTDFALRVGASPRAAAGQSPAVLFENIVAE